MPSKINSGLDSQWGKKNLGKRNLKVANLLGSSGQQGGGDVLLF